jgi:hypothetical protein
MNITIIGLDIAKQVFHAACCNEQGKLGRVYGLLQYCKSKHAVFES